MDDGLYVVLHIADGYRETAFLSTEQHTPAEFDRTELKAGEKERYKKKHQLWAYPARLLQRLWHPKTTRIQPSVLQLLLPSLSTASRLVGVACSLVQASYSL
jgi:hypothetical protein